MKCLITIAWVLLTVNASAQKHSKRPGPPTRWDCDVTCTYNSYPSLAIRKTKFPFNKTASVTAISFLSKFEFYTTPPPASTGSTLKDTFGYTAVREIISLTAAQQDSLSALFYNFYPANYFRQHKNCVTMDGDVLCYDPHHALIFQDSAGRQIARIELCFHCGNYRLAPPDLDIGMVCDSRMALFQGFLRWVGIVRDDKRE